MNTVHIRWTSSINWNELCIRVLEHYGLPGGKYTTKLDTNWMEFIFKDEKDAFLCKIMLSEHGQ
jgi:hypothetical protein